MYVPIITTDVVINLKMVTLVAGFSLSVEYILRFPHSELVLYLFVEDYIITQKLI